MTPMAIHGTIIKVQTTLHGAVRFTVETLENIQPESVTVLIKMKDIPAQWTISPIGDQK